MDDHALVASDEELRLRRFNLLMAVLHAGQAAAMLVLSNDFALPVTTNFLDGPPGTGPGTLTEQVALRLGPMVATFLLISAVFHLIVASPWGFPRYVAELRRHQNRFRWVEYAFSASLMIVVIAMLTGISDAVALLALFGVNASMILFGWLMETTNDPEREAVSWTPFVFGCIAGAIPWLGILIYLLGPGGDVPGFVYGIFITLFVFFNCFAVNQWLQYRRVGRWHYYLFGERAYVWLSLTAKSVLAWLVFANVLLD